MRIIFFGYSIVLVKQPSLVLYESLVLLCKQSMPLILIAKYTQITFKRLQAFSDYNKELCI